MRLGSKSKEILELVAAFSLEAFEATIELPRLYKIMSYPSERSFRKTTELLKQKGMLDVKSSDGRGEWVSLLTDRGKEAINQHLDPTALWNESWDGDWRLLSFDLPKSASAARQALRKWLESHRFGRLQGSVWITPRDLGDWTVQLEELDIDSKYTIYMRGRLGNQQDPSNYVDRAWDFEKINERYEDHMNFLKTSHSTRSSTFKTWFQKESHLWRKAFDIDPFLPRDLWTTEFQSQYLGPAALQERNRIYKDWKAKLFGKLT